MNGSKFFLVLFLLLLGLTTFGLINKFDLFVLLGHVFLLQIMAVWFFFHVKKMINIKTKLIIFGLLVGSLSDVSILLGLKAIGELIQITLGVLVNLIFLIVIRFEGVSIYSEKYKGILLLSIPAVIIFLFFGVFILPNVPNMVFGVSVLYAMVELFLIIHSLFRITNKKSYILVLLGVVLLVIKDGLYSLHFFVFHAEIYQLYVFQYPLNVLAYFFIVYGLAANIAFEPFGVTNTSNKRLSKFINEILDLKFSDILKLKAPYQ